MKQETTPSPSIPVKDELLDMFKREWYVINGEENSRLFPSVIMGSWPKSKFYQKPHFCVNETPTSEKGTHTIVAKAICTAVNNTYGKGFNPAAMEELHTALQAIKARLDGEWDHPALVAYGLLSNRDSDILNICTAALEKAKLNP